MFANQFTINAKSGAVLNVYHEPATGQPRGVVVINHGLAEHAARYARFAKVLSANGYHVYAHDHRGHGHTKVLGISLGTFAKVDGWQRALDDTLEVRGLAMQKHPGLPLILFGHSMGGLISMNSALRDPNGIAALAVWNANFSAGLLGRIGQLVLGVERMLLGSDVPSSVLPKLTFQDWSKKETDGRTASDWLSHDHAEVDAYEADPLCGWSASVSMWQDVFKLVFHGANDANFRGLAKTLPINLRGGERDPATEFAKATRALSNRLSKMGFSNVTTDIGPYNRHESLNDTNREEVVDRFLVWLDKILR
ncbi:MAG: alpha/beta fold hydrolase [Rhizobiaceae bacterium]